VITWSGLGFQPGFPYLGGLSPELHTPRRAEPRLSVPAGTVAIGGEQTGIYPLASPGGWQLIGHTSTPLFEPGQDAPILLRPGDTLRFIPQKEGMLTLIRAGLYTSVQDVGRFGLRQSGVSYCGALDRPALEIANLLVGNPGSTAALEITLGQCVIEFGQETWFA
jgi:hypothetical protein